MTKQQKIILALSVALAVFVVAISAFYLITTQSTPDPFSFRLIISPDNVEVMQGGNTTIALEAVHLNGTPEPITLLVSGGPNGTLYQFSNQTGTLTKTQPFTSKLTIAVLSSAVSGSYLIDITGNASASNNHMLFNLTVLNAQIQVYGNVTIDSKVTISGATLDVIPTDILFTSNTTGETYQAKIHRFTDTPLAPGRTGNYSIILPNQQNYKVEFYCFSYPHFIPVLRAPAAEKVHLTVSCGAGVDASVANFIG